MKVIYTLLIYSFLVTLAAAQDKDKDKDNQVSCDQIIPSRGISYKAVIDGLFDDEAHNPGLTLEMKVEAIMAKGEFESLCNVDADNENLTHEAATFADEEAARLTRLSAAFMTRAAKLKTQRP